MFGVIGGQDGIDCVLCDERSDAIEEHEAHMEEVHDLGVP